jgi:2-polyprenyl-3-methyl-5-hydroxy-6-metoxy-1,4-benzoquinol methylase
MINLLKREKFWDKKIIEWEGDRYFTKNLFLKKNSVKYRLYYAKQILRKFVKNKKILELGCGSGLLAQSIIKYGAKNYTGYDLSLKAIQNANLINKNKNVRFFHGSILSVKNYKNYDLIISLGLIDWLNENELTHIALISKGKMWLHSFSEKKITLFQIIHRIYTFLSYGYKNNMYVLRYDTRQKIKEILQTNNISFFNNKKLSFGTIAHNFNNEK